MTNICVIGAGVIGLTTATLVQEAVPGAKVTLIADKFEDSTTSIGAGGIFLPSTNLRGPSPEIAIRWLTDGFEYYSKLLNSSEASEAGLRPLSGYRLSRDNPDFVKVSLESMVDFRLLTPQEVRSFHGDWKYGSFLKTMLVENQRFLPYLMKKFRGAGGLVRKDHVTSLEDLANEFDVICNCSGLGARKLCGDLNVFPIRGQVFQVKAPWIEHLYMTDQGSYIIPGIAHVTVGGTYQFDNWRLEPDEHDSRAIWDRCTRLVPSLKDAKVVREWVGLRPFRHVVRVEREVVHSKQGKTAHVIHNYGHGAYGVLSAPGTSMHATRLVTEAVNSLNKAKL